MSRKISFNGQTFVVPDDASDDEITQIAGGGSSAPPAPNAGLAGPAKPAGLGGPVKEGSGANQAPLIANAPEESGLESGPLVATNPSENDTLTHGAGTFRALARSANAASEALNPLKQVPALFHAAFDKPQDPTQRAEEAGAETAGKMVNPAVPAALSRLIYRSAIKPTANAIEDYSAGNVTPEAAASVAPEALGAAGGTVIAGKTIDSLPGAVSSTSKLFPSTAEAGKAFAPIEAAAKSTPVDTSAARAIAEEAKQFDDTGATMPKVMRRFLSRTAGDAPMDPQSPVFYPEARKFAENAGKLSVSETLAAKPQMQRLVGKFAGALKDANRAAAEEVGMGAQYDDAMKTYRGAAGREKMLANLGDVAKKAAIGALGLKGMHYIISSAKK